MVFVLQCSNLSPFTNFLNFFHLSFGNELIIRVKTTYIMKRICKFWSSVKGNKRDQTEWHLYRIWNHIYPESYGRSCPAASHSKCIVERDNHHNKIFAGWNQVFGRHEMLSAQISQPVPFYIFRFESGFFTCPSHNIIACWPMFF